MRVILINFLAVRAAGQITRATSFIKRLRQYDTDSKIIVLKEPGSLLFCENRDDIKIINIPLINGQFKAVFRMLWENVSLPSLLKAFKVNVYITFSHYLPWTFPKDIMSIVGVSNLAPFSIEAHKSEISLLPKLRLAVLKKTIISSTRRADKVIALSKLCREMLISRGIDANKISVIPNGVEMIVNKDTSGNLEPVLNYNIPRENILYVSNFYRYKNFARLVDAYSLLSKDLIDRYSLILVGTPYDRQYYNEIYKKAEKLGITDNVIMIPGLPHDELYSIYKGGTVFVFPTLIENSPNILLEAMSYGLPIITSNIEPMKEYAGNAALYFNPLSIKDIAEKITTVLKNKDMIENMRIRSENRSKIYSWDNFTSSVVSIYKN